MPDYPAAIIAKAADAIERELMSGTYYDTHVESEEALARVALDAVAADLGEAVARKIREHYARTGPQTATTAQVLARRRHFQIAAQVAAFAFLTEDDKKRMAAEALATGNYVACPAPEDSTREH